MKKVTYTVHAYRYGDNHGHSYLVGLYSKKHAALVAADAEYKWRGGKYECEVREWVVDGVNDDKSPGMPSRLILGVPY